eukprot:scaffold18578_cov127-Isochrysis_galbana.AAC.3
MANSGLAAAAPGDRPVRRSSGCSHAGVPKPTTGHLTSAAGTPGCDAGAATLIIIASPAPSECPVKRRSRLGWAARTSATNSNAQLRERSRLIKEEVVGARVGLPGCGVPVQVGAPECNDPSLGPRLQKEEGAHPPPRGVGGQPTHPTIDGGIDCAGVEV